MILRVWCDLHDVALAAFDGAPFMIEVEPPRPGHWMVDLSDMDCPGRDVADEDSVCSDHWTVTMAEP